MGLAPPCPRSLTSSVALVGQGCLGLGLTLHARQPGDGVLVVLRPALVMHRATLPLPSHADTFALQEARASQRVQDLVSGAVPPKGTSLLLTPAGASQASKLEMSERVRSEVAGRLKEEEARSSQLEARVKEGGHALGGMLRETAYILLVSSMQHAAGCGPL